MRALGPTLVACLALPLLSGCAAGVAGLALSGASLLTSIMTDSGEGQPHIDFDPNRDLSETLAAAEHEIDPVCRARLDVLRKQMGPIEPPAPGQCAARPVCLGGTRNPMEVMVCADGASPAPGEPGETEPARESGSAWTWRTAEGRTVQGANADSAAGD
jgi:hypothetical protein